jgi:hypothetical protein
MPLFPKKNRPGGPGRKTKQKRVRIVPGESKFGLLLVTDITVDANDVTVFECECECGTSVRRMNNTLFVRKFQCCDSCRREYVAEALEQKSNDRRKNPRRYNAYDQPAL